MLFRSNLSDAIRTDVIDVVSPTDNENGTVSEESKPDMFKDIGIAAFWDKPMSINKTGNWRVLNPKYVTKQAPCTSNCPAGTDVRMFVDQAAEKKFEEAFRTIYKHNPFPPTCGRVCPHFCQQNCNRAEFDGDVNIGAIERFLGDRGITDDVKPFDIKHDEKVAVVGSGPAGLTAALRLCEQGYKTKVFEALPKAGGMMRVGIPGFRLPQDVLDNEISMIEKQGVEIVLNKKVKISEIARDFDAVIVAAGSHIGSSMKIPNEDLALEGLQFLHEFKMNEIGRASCRERV